MSGRCRRRIRKISDIDKSVMLSMHAAVNAVLTKQIPITVAAQAYGVNVTLLQRRLDRVKENKFRQIAIRKYPNKNSMTQVFTTQEEKVLEDHLLRIAKEVPLSMTCIRKLAYEYALRVPNCKYQKKWDAMQMMGINWAYSYRSRHPKINSVIEKSSSIVKQSKASGSAGSGSVRPESETMPVSVSDIFEGKQIIVRVYQYLEKEYEYIKFFNKEGSDLSPLANILKRTSAATGVSEHVVSALLDQYRAAKQSLKQDRQYTHSTPERDGVNSETAVYVYEPQTQCEMEVESRSKDQLENEQRKHHEGDTTEATSEERTESGTEPKQAKRKKKNRAALQKATKEGATALEITKQHGTTPTTTLDDRDNKDIEEPTLTSDEEKKIVEWIEALGETGFRVTRKNLLDTIGSSVKNEKSSNILKGRIPTRYWYKKLVSRHPHISELVITKYKPCRASEQSFRSWYDQVEEYLKEKNILSVVKDPSRIFNLDEIGLFLNPMITRPCGFVRRAANDSSWVVQDEREFLTAVINVSASGLVAPSMVLYPPGSEGSVPSVPQGFSVGHTKSGWLDSDTFSKYIIDSFYPWLVEKVCFAFPIVVFLDGCASFISPSLLKFCQEKGIVLIGLLPNTTQTLQPLEVAVFKPVEQTWKTVVRNFTSEHNSALTQVDFANQVKNCLDLCVSSRTLEIGFKMTGFYPFGGNNVNYNRLLSKNPKKINIANCE